MPGFERLGEEEKRQILDVLDTGVLFRYEFGDQRNGIYKVKEFEEKFAAYTGTAYGQAVTSGTAAVKVALKALGVGIGDEVITQGFTFVATWEAILEVGAIPVFTEIDESLNMDPEDLANKISPKTKCIMPVHMLGSAARIDEIVAIGDAAGIAVLEDCAQAAGCRVKGRHVGSIGRCGTFSFDSVKTMTTGEGGMIVTDDYELWQSMSEYQDHGHDHRPNPGGRGGEGRRFIGFNYRMMELQGAIGLAQLAKLDDFVATQRRNKDRLREIVSLLPNVSFRHLPDEAGDSASHLAFMLADSEQRRRVNAVLQEEGVGAVCFGENSWHFFPQWEHLLAGATQAANGWPFNREDSAGRITYSQDQLPESMRLLERTLVYPVMLNMDDDRFAFIEAAIRKAASV
jgi:8-amino-3,8-dideoxy-alpha-D-manno-octulosonate transaminase